MDGVEEIKCTRRDNLALISFGRVINVVCVICFTFYMMSVSSIFIFVAIRSLEPLSITAWRRPGKGHT